MRAIATVGLLTAASCCVFAQPPAAPPAFEVASVKSSLLLLKGDEVDRREAIEPSPSGLIMRNISLGSCIEWAYRIKDYQLSGPAWLSSERYSIAARASAAASDDQLRAMLQTLLSDRFHLTLHREKRDVTAVALLPGKGEPKFKESQSEGPGVVQGGKLTFTARHASMQELADLLARPLRMPVIDMTGLQGRYDFSVDVAPYIPDLLQVKKGEAEVDMASVIFTTVQKELGLKLESRKAPLEVLVIDHAEKIPTEN